MLKEKYVRLSEIVCSDLMPDEFDIIQKVVKCWQNIVNDNIKHNKDYKDSDECKRFKQEISDVVNDELLNASEYLHLALDLRTIITHGKDLVDRVVKCIMQEYFGNEEQCNNFISLMNLIDNVWKLLSEDQKEGYYQGAGTFSMIDNMLEVGFYDKSFLEQEYGELLCYILIARCD